MMRRTIFKASLAAIAFTSASALLAATDGNLAMDGAASNGTSDLTIVKQVSVQITSMDDLDFGTHAQLAADEVETDDVCVFASNTTYFVTVSSANGAFQMVGSDPANTINYGVSWGSDALAYDTQIGVAQSGNAIDSTCGGIDNASYTVTIAQADFNAATYDTYTDTLIVSIIPE